jgi:hypothetical protein
MWVGTPNLLAEFSSVIFLSLSWDILVQYRKLDDSRFVPPFFFIPLFISHFAISLCI